MKRILDGTGVPYTVHYVDVDESASKQLADVKQGQQKEELPLLGAGATMLLVRAVHAPLHSLAEQCLTPLRLVCRWCGRIGRIWRR